MSVTLNTTPQPQFVWPLPGTKLPNAHLTRTEWLNVLANVTTGRQPEHAASERAA